MPRDVIRRARLDELFEAGLQERSVLAVCAAPGTGKTVQAQLYATATGLTTAWLTLDDAHRSSGRLLDDLGEALRDHRRADADAATRSAFRLTSTMDEAAGLVASSLRPDSALLVIDDIQHLDGADEALRTLESVLNLCPPALHIVLLSRTNLDGPLLRRLVDGRVDLIEEDELRLTRAECAELGTLIGSTVPADEVFEATGGWTAGAAFGFRYGLAEQRVSRHLPSAIMDDVLARLTDAERRFLLETSVADTLTTEVAVALCGPGAHALWDSVRALHLPASTVTNETLTYHALFRDFLHRRLLAEDPAGQLELVGRYARYLLEHGEPERATELFLSVDEPDAALTAAEQVVLSLCERSDWSTVLRWTEKLGTARVDRSPVLLSALIRSTFGRRSFEATVELVRRLDREGRLRAATEADGALLATAAWALQAQPSEAQRLLDRYHGDYRADVVRFMLAVCTQVQPAVPPLGGSWDDMERIMCWGLLLQGRLKELRSFLPADPDVPVLNPNVVLALVFDGDHATARSLWHRVPTEIRQRPQSHFIEAILLVGEGELQLALEALNVALADSRPTTFFLSPAYEVFCAWVLVRLDRIDDAVSILRRRIETNSASGQTALLEWAQAFLGYAFLVQGRDEEARVLLDECTRSMVRAQRRLFLPFAATCLSEAQARGGDLAAAAETADLAYHCASLIGSFATVTPVLAVFPDIAAREDEREPPRGMRWRRLTVAPSARPPKQAATDGDTRLALQPFGTTRDIFVNGVAQHIGRVKIVELLAYLVLHPGGTDRRQLQDALFPDASLRNGGNHFRQISFKFRQITGLSLDRTDGHVVGLPGGTIVDATDVQFEEVLRTVSWVTPEERVDRLRGALGMVAGPYLSGSNLAWAEERRNHLDVVQEEARLELVRLLLELGRPEEAREECEAVLVLNRYSDPAYRLLVQIERTIGSESSVLAAYRQAVEALEELGLAPGDARRLMAARPASPRAPRHRPELVER